MSLPILSTKFHRPALPPRQIPRPQLIQRLNDGLASGSRITLVSAPAGFGKTICISEWLSRLALPIAWLSLDPADDDPVRFFTCLIAALQRLHPDLGKAVESALNSGQLPPSDAIAAALMADLLGIDGQMLLVLDDFHWVQDSAILQFFDHLLAGQPVQLHLVLVTREDPLLPLSRLRASGSVTEIRAADLRFSQEEAGHFLNDRMQLSLSDGDIAALENRTEGWAAGLQLAALALRSLTDRDGAPGPVDASTFIANLSGSHRYILRYLTEEVLNRQPPDVQAFLLQTAILDRFNADLCDAVVRDSSTRDSLYVIREDEVRFLSESRTTASSQAVLEYLERTNLFLIPLDDEQRWYRYHHLFADLLRSQQKRIQREQVTELHRRASRWYEKNGMPGEAIEHALAAADYPAAVQLLERHAMHILLQGYGRTVEGWMQAIPAELRSRSPRANLAFASLYLLRGSYDRIAPYLKQVEAALAAGPEADGLRAEWLAVRANLLNVQGGTAEQIAEGIHLARQALDCAQPDDFYARGLAYLGLGGAYRLMGDYPNLVEAYQLAIQHSRAGGYSLVEMLAVTALSLMAIRQGQLHFAAQVCTQAIDRYDSRGSPPPPISGPVYGALGIVYYEWNRLEKARELFLRGGALNSLTGHNAGVVYYKTLLSRLLLAEGDLAAAARAIQEAADLLPLGAPPWLRPEVAAQQVRVYLAQHNPIAAEAVLKANGLPFSEKLALQEPPDSPAELLYFAALRLLLYRVSNPARSAADPALDRRTVITLASRLIANAARSQRAGVWIQALLLRALLNAAFGGTSAAGNASASGSGASISSISAALNDIDDALTLAEPEGYMRVFIDEGPAMTALLKAAGGKAAVSSAHSLNRSARLAYIKELLAAFPPSNGAASAFEEVQENVSTSSPLPLSEFAPQEKVLSLGEAEPLPESAPLSEALTNRELDVLRLIAAGLKYQEIAERLVISPNTVRFYIKEIYSKLNVNNRTRAVEAARRVGLL